MEIIVITTLQLSRGPNELIHVTVLAVCLAPQKCELLSELWRQMVSDREDPRKSMKRRLSSRCPQSPAILSISISSTRLRGPSPPILVSILGCAFFPDLNQHHWSCYVHMSHLEILLKRIFEFYGSGWDLGFRTCNKHPGFADFEKLGTEGHAPSTSPSQQNFVSTLAF